MDINILETYRNTYHKKSKLIKEKNNLEEELDVSNIKKINKIKSKYNFLFCIPLISYLIMVYIFNPLGDGSTLLQNLFLGNDQEQSVYNEMSLLMICNFFIYITIISFYKKKCNEKISKEIVKEKKDNGLLVEINFTKILMALSLLILSIFTAFSFLKNGNCVLLFLFFISFAVIEGIYNKRKKNNNKKIKSLNKETFLKKLNKKEEITKKLNIEIEIEERLRNKILNEAILMKKVINTFNSEEKKDESFCFLIESLKTKNEEKDKEKSEKQKLNNIYENYYEKNIENVVAIEND